MAHKCLNQDLWQGRWTPRVRPSSPKFLLLWAGSQSTVVRFYWNCSKAGMMVNWRWESGWSRIHCARGEGRLVMVVWSNQPAAVAWTAKNYLKASAEKKSSLLLTFLMIVGHVLYCLSERTEGSYTAGRSNICWYWVIWSAVMGYALWEAGEPVEAVGCFGKGPAGEPGSCWRTWVLLENLGPATQTSICGKQWTSRTQRVPAGLAVEVGPTHY